MATHNANYEIINLIGTMGSDILGNGISASTVHQLFCIADGSITVNAVGGGSATWAATAGQTMDILPSKVNVISGEFIGFRAKHYNRRFNMQGQ